jgi:Uma2 family endonuclease
MTVSPGYSRVVLPVALLEERKRLGLDRRDEVWDGELHMVPPASLKHQSAGTRLILALGSIARRRRYELVYEAGVRDPTRGWDDFRVPDVIVADPQYTSDAAIEGRAELVIEVLSPNDESRHKFGFYAKRQVQEVWIVEPKTLAIEVYALRDDHYERVMPVDGIIRAPSLGIELLLGDGTLRIQDGEAIVDV